ncbi:MAG: energy-coupling factor ABC transporter permease [Lachnospiraceae bacterium]
MKNWNKPERIVFLLSITIAAVFGSTQNVSAMHIMEGYLPLAFCILWGLICLPFLTAGYINIRRNVRKKRRTLILYAMSGAFIFVISSLKIPSVTGSCSHMTGTGLSAILFGVTSTSILGIIVLIFQALLLAHGGLTTLGANTFSMAIAGPIIAFLIYRLGMKLKWNRLVTIFFAAMLGDFMTYCITSIQLALAYPDSTGGLSVSLVKFLAVFAPTQIPLAIMEGILTVLIFMGLQTYAAPELRDLGIITEDTRHVEK